MTIDKSRQRLLWVAGAIAGIGILSYYLFRNPKRAMEKKEVPETHLKKRVPESQISKNTEVQKIKKETLKVPLQEHQIFPLQKGSTGKEVERLQVWLLRNHGWKGSVTGIYDAQTETLVKKRLKKNAVDQATYKKHQMGTPVYEQIHT
jgi:hypothetical protein